MHFYYNVYTAFNVAFFPTGLSILDSLITISQSEFLVIETFFPSEGRANDFPKFTKETTLNGLPPRNSFGRAGSGVAPGVRPKLRQLPRPLST